MAIGVFKDAKVYLAQYDVSGDANKVTLALAHAEKVCTVFGNAAEKVRGGLATIALDAEGYLQFGSGLVHHALKSQINVADVLCSVAPVGADGDYCEFAKVREGVYTPGLRVGEYASFKVGAKGQGDASIAGTIMGTGVKTVTGAGTGRQVGAVGATQSLFAALHVFAVTGITPTLTVNINSDDNAGFTSEVLRATFAQQVAPGWEYLTPIPGPITDNWWRVGWTIGGTGSPSFALAIIIGIANDKRAP